MNICKIGSNVTSTIGFQKLINRNILQSFVITSFIKNTCTSNSNGNITARNNFTITEQFTWLQNLMHFPTSCPAMKSCKATLTNSQAIRNMQETKLGNFAASYLIGIFFSFQIKETVFSTCACVVEHI